MRRVLAGTGGFPGRIDSEMRCALWVDGPVDHGTAGGIAVGLRSPGTGVGDVSYLDRGSVAALPGAPRPAVAPVGMAAHPYECMTARYLPHLDDPRAGNCYFGHHAVILQEQGSLAQVAVYPPGKSQAPGVSPVLMWIDLASPEQCDTGSGSLTTIGTGNALKRGALFLISSQLPDYL